MDTKQQTESIHNLLESKSKELGDQEFIWDKWHSDVFTPYTYNDLKGDVQTIASYLLSVGGEKEYIMIFSENSYFWFATSLAISGYVGTCVAANKDWQAYDIQNALSSIDIKKIIYSAKSAPIIDELKELFPDISYISMDKIADIAVRNRKKRKDYKLLTKHAKDSQEPSQIIFTTGSSGIPKAVPISYRNIASCKDMTLSRLPLTPNDTMYLFLPLHHVFGNVSAITAIKIGYSLYICSDTTKINNEMKECSPTIICGVPLFYQKVFDKLDKKTKNKINTIAKITNPLANVGLDIRKVIFKKLYTALGGKLEYLVCGAAPLNPEIKQLFLNVGIDFVEAYGMSETCAFITMEKRGEQIADSVGTPYDIVDCKIIGKDKDGIGEVVIKGPNVFQGYYKQGKIDKTAFDKKGYFHTGDLGYFDKQGRLFLTGRKKRLILTSNGENVSPDELEGLISKQLKAKKIKVFATDEGIATIIFPLENDGRANDEFKAVIDEINLTLPRFKQIRVVNVNRNSEMSVK